MRDTFLRTRTTTTVNGFALFHARQLLFLVRPQQSPESKAPGQQNETGDGGSLCPERGHGNNTATAQTPSVDPPSSKGVGSNGSRLALQSSTLESTPEEDSDTSLSHDTDGADRRARRKSTKAGCQQQPSGIDGASATITSESHNSDPLRDKGRDDGSGEIPLGGVYWPGGKQPAGIERLPSRSTVDWEVAVVMSSTGADEMVSCR